MKHTNKIASAILAVLVAVVLVIVNSSWALAEGTWTTKAPMPAARSLAAAAVINDVLYVAGGHDGVTGGTTTLQAYNLTTNTWSTLAAMPGRRYAGDGAGVINGELYVAGGWNYPDSGIPTSSLFIYNPGTNSWRSAASMPTLSGDGASGVINGKLYVTTAANGFSGWRNFLHVYDPGADSWSSLASSPNAHAGPAYGVINGKFYVAGGGDANGTPSDKLDIYDPATNTWTTKAPMPAARQGSAGAVINGKLYVSGGSNAGVYYNTVYVYDPLADTWTTETSMPTARSGAAGGVINGVIYVAGGNGSTGTLATVEAFTLGTWTSKTPMPAARAWAAAGVINGILYVAGGNSGLGPTSTLQAYNPVTDTWSTLTSMPGSRDTGVGAGVIDGKLYVAGGWSGSLPTNTLFVYDPANNSWSTKASIPQAYPYYGSGHGASGVINGKLYVYSAATGYDGWWKFLHVYDPGTDSWTRLADSPNVHVTPASGVIGDKFYLAGGDDWSGNSANWKTLDMYDPATNTWTTKAPMPGAGRGFASTVLNGKLYVTGGDNGTSNLNTVYVYDPTTDSWAIETSMPTARSGAAGGVINGVIYVAGGSNSSGTLATVEAFTEAAAPPPAPTGLTKISTDNNPLPAFKWNAVAGNITYEVKMDSGNWADIGNKLTYIQPSVLSKASHTFSVRAKDSGGSTGAATSLSFSVTATADLANTKIAFGSNRDGNAEVYVMNADGTNQTRLTNNAATDNAPSWSPDGTKIAFISSRDGNDEIYIMNADGTNQTRLTNNTATDNAPSWSPDGTKIAFGSNRDGSGDIYIMNADGSGQTNLTKNAVWDAIPDWSPDGTKIAFISSRDGNDEIYVMNADGTNQTNLTNNAAGYLGRDYLPFWSPDGTKITFHSYRDGEAEIYVMNADGSSQTRLTNNTAIDVSGPWSPDGTKIIFQSYRDGNAEIYVMNADGTNQTRLTNNTAGDGGPAWSPFLASIPPTTPTGLTKISPDNNPLPAFKWNAVAGNVTYEVKMDSGTWTNVGNKLTYVQPSVLTKASHTFSVRAKDSGGNTGTEASLTFSVSVEANLTNTKIAFGSDRDGNREIYIMKADGTSQTRLTNNAAEDGDPSWSPDGTKIVFQSNPASNWDIFAMNADGTNQTRLTNNAAADNAPSWSPDGTKIAFASNRDGNDEIYVMNADGTNQTNLTNNAAWDFMPDWSPDGTKIAFASNPASNWDIFVMNADGTNQTNLTNNAAVDSDPAWSPDGTKIAFSSNRDGNSEIYSMNADGTNQTRLTNSYVDAFYPSWSPDGTKIVFQSNPASNWDIFVMNADGTNQTRLTNNSVVDFGPAWSPFAVFAINTFTITTSPGANGSIAPAGAVTVNYGASQSFTISANTSYHIADVLVDGLSVGAVSSYTFTNVTTNHTIAASFAINTYAITASAGANGTISPSGAVTVNYGASQSFTITPNTGYHVADVLVDGSSVGAVSSYTFTTVTANHTIAASFAINTYTITASAGANGTISPSGAVTVNYGANQTFTITPNTGYHIADVLVDGSSVGAVSSYTFTNVTTNHTIAASFAITNQPPTQPSNLSPGNGATNVSLTLTLFSSSFADPDSGDTHLATQWQITATAGNYASPAFDSGTDTSHLAIIGVPSGALNYSTTYYWRVRHQDNHSDWSGYSAETSFITIAQTTPPPTTPSPPAGRRSLPDPSTLAMVGSGLAAGLFYIGLSRLRQRLSRS